MTNLRMSDHRPVWATFNATIDIVNHELKNNLRRALYDEKQREAFSDPVHLLDVDDEDSIVRVSDAPGLPPPSSERNRWWLDNGG